MSQEKKSSQVSRRNFMKLSAASGAGVAAAGYGIVKDPVKSGTAYAAINLGKEHDEMPLEISPDYERMRHKNIIFMREVWDPTISSTVSLFKSKELSQVPPSGGFGYREIELAMVTAGWSVNHFGADGSQAGIANIGLYSWEGAINDRKTTFKNPEEATVYVKKAANFFGASLVGIAKYDERWTYSHFYNPMEDKEIPAEFPFKPKSVISIAIEMDYEAYKTAPSILTSAASGKVYSNMAETAHKVATFVRQLGYKAIPCGNDTGLSIPIAISAGLGELSRAGILVTEKYGPRVRLCKVFTELELVPDKPITFGVKEFCEVCLKCADNCPSGAISKEKEMSFKTQSVSNNHGVKKWCVDADKCITFWSEVGGDCGSCIASCPYNKIEEWHHDITKLATLSPAKPALRYLDELFGYGKTYNEEAIEDFWGIKKD